MNKTSIAVIITLTLFSGSPAFGWTAPVVGVTDGDTIKVLHDGRETKIRLYGIDTPEKKQAFGQKAKAFTAGMVAGKNVDVEAVDRDRYGRTVGIVTVDGRNLNEDLVGNGYAWVYRQYCKRKECGTWINLESRARDAEAGLWADSGAVPPWEWRKR